MGPRAAEGAHRREALDIKPTIVRVALELSGDPKVPCADRGEQSKLGCAVCDCDGMSRFVN